MIEQTQHLFTVLHWNGRITSETRYALQPAVIRTRRYIRHANLNPRRVAERYVDG